MPIAVGFENKSRIRFLLFNGRHYGGCCLILAFHLFSDS